MSVVIALAVAVFKMSVDQASRRTLGGACSLSRSDAAPLHPKRRPISCSGGRARRGLCLGYGLKLELCGREGRKFCLIRGCLLRAISYKLHLNAPAQQSRIYAVEMEEGKYGKVESLALKILMWVMEYCCRRLRASFVGVAVFPFDSGAGVTAPVAGIASRWDHDRGI